MNSNIKRLKLIDYAVIVFYFIVLLGIGLFFSHRQKNLNDYFKGGGRIPWFIAGLSIFGTALSAITFMSVPAKAFYTDWSYMIFSTGTFIVVPVIVLLFIPLFRKLNVTTAYEYLEIRFDATVRVICSISFILFQISRMGVILLLPAIALNMVTGIDIMLCVYTMGLLSIIYTMMGGIEAVAWTDALQVIILLGAAITILAISFVKIPAESIIEQTCFAGKMNFGSTTFDLRQPTLWTTLIATIFTNITTYGSDQTIVQRYLTTSTEKEARKGVYTNALLSIPATVIFFSVGTMMWAFYRHFPHELSLAMNSQDSILPWFISTQLPSGVLGLVIAGLFAAAMSTISSSMNSAATALCTDILSKVRKKGCATPSLHLARLTTLVVGLIGIGFAVIISKSGVASLWDEFNKLLGLLLGGLGGLFLLGFTCKRASSASAIAGILASIIVQLIFLQSDVINPLLYSSTGFVSCYLVGWIVSIFFPNKQKCLTC